MRLNFGNAQHEQAEKLIIYLLFIFIINGTNVL